MGWCKADKVYFWKELNIIRETLYTLLLEEPVKLNPGPAVFKTFLIFRVIVLSFFLFFPILF